MSAQNNQNQGCRLNPFCQQLGWLCALIAVLLSASGVIAAPAAREDIRIVEIQGMVEISPAGAKTWVLTQTNQQLHAHDRLRTGENSRAAIRWSDQSVIPLGASTEIEIQPAPNANSDSGLNLVRGVMSFFHREKPGRIRIITRGSVAGIEGTEFVLAVDDSDGAGRTTISVIDGRVVFSDPFGAGTLSLTNGEQAVAEVGKAPVRTAGFVANNVLQWCFYYPAVLDLNDLELTAEEGGALAESLEAYRSGDVLRALAKYPSDRKADSDAERIYHTALLLAVGEVATAEAVIASLADKEPSSHFARLGSSLRLLIAAVRAEPGSPTASPRTSTELLAASYHAQSRAVAGESLTEALLLARQAVAASPNFGFAWERIAELEFSFGRTDRASEALAKSLQLAPRNAQALALKGFLLAAKNRTREAADWFGQALAVDSAIGNAWLGRGLCRIRSGELAAGREDLLIAAALEPQRAALRSYLGKAWSISGDDTLAQREFGLAQKLDPNDPTSWLYSALNNQQQNRLNEAIRDLEKSQDLNDNRRVYRSQLLLDQDRAVRSASLASIYRENGMTDVSLREAAHAVTYDYANYSAHLFLANSYDALRDPTRFNLRQETTWFNELLLANLLSPAGVPTLSQNISQQEYSRMFERERLGLVTTTELRSDGQYREVASQFGAVGPLSWSLDLDAQHNDGVRPNNDLSRIEWYSTIKLQVSARDSLFLLTKYQDYHSGDNFQYFDPGAVTLATNIFTSAITSNTAYRPNFKFDEYQKPIALGAYHREWSPGVHTLALGGRLENDQRFSDRTVPLYVLSQDNLGNLVGVSSSDFDVAYRSQLEIWTGELKQIFQTSRNTLLLGGRYQGGQFKTQNALTNTTIFSSFFPVLNQTTVADMQRWSVYAYDTLEIAPSRLWLTAGLSYDNVEYPENFRQIPVSSVEASASQLGPKAAMVWSPCSEATVRAAYSRSLGGVSLDESYRLEPSQLAGFIQSYRTIIPESVVGSVAAPRFETFNAALDLKPGPRTYVGLFGEILNSDVDRELGTYGFPDSSGFAFPSSTPQQLRYNEYSASLVVNQLLSTEWAVGAAYKFTRSELDQTLTDVPLAVFADAKRFDSSDLHNLKLYALYSHGSGLFARAEADCYWQDNRARTYDTAGTAINATLPDDQFCQLNLWFGYRFRRALGDISVGVLNVSNSDYRLNPLNAYSELPRERVVAARVRLRF